MDIIFVDLEWNGAPLYATGGYYNEIIEIGAVRVSEKFEHIDTFQSFIRPQVHKRLTGRVKRLTHISNNEVRGAISFLAALELFRKWVGSGDNCFMTWGMTDLTVWLENLEHINRPQALESAHYYCDAQELCRAKLCIEKRKQPGLSTVAEQIGVDILEDEMHRAVTDCMVSLECLKKLWDEELFEKLRVPVDGEFVRRLTFKPVNIVDIDNPLVDKTKFDVECPQCGAVMNRSSEIRQRNKAINIKYRCPACDRLYIVKHIFRLNFDGVAYKRNIREIIIPPEGEAEGAAAEGTAAEGTAAEGTEAETEGVGNSAAEEE